MNDIATHLTKEQKEELRERILHVLDVYPGISPTMLQMGLGPATKPRDWKPILEHLIEIGEVIRHSVSGLSPHERHHSYVKLTLKKDFRGDLDSGTEELVG